MATKRNGDEPIKHWLAELISPQTLVVIAVLIGGGFAAWVTIQTRISVLETQTAVVTAQLQKEIDKIETEARQHSKDEDDSEVKRIDTLQRSFDADTQRLWLDIQELRHRVTENTLLIGQSIGKR